MMKMIELGKEKIYRGTLLLVNARYPLKSQRIDNLIPVDARYPDILMKREAVNMLRLIFEKIKSKNCIVPVSGYRSAEEQASIYDMSFCENGEEFTSQYVALPNHSEHQTGLAIDLGLNKKDIDFIRPYFPYEGICGEFRKAASDFGFIERYEKGKENITGISHEPWHFRYVGCPHAGIIVENGFSLEEYLERIKDYREECRLIYRNTLGAESEIYYIPATAEKVRIAIPENCAYQISGNNADGFIVTLWR